VHPAELRRWKEADPDEVRYNDFTQPVSQDFDAFLGLLWGKRQEGQDMSSAVYVYAVPVDRLHAIPGSRDKRLLAAMQQSTGFFEMVDRIAADHEEEEEGQPPACAEAVRQIINGEPCDTSFGYVYGYAYEALCMAIGAETKQSWTSIVRSYDWFPRIDRALAALGIPLKVNDLLCRGALIEIPAPDDFPSLGWWTNAEIATAAGVLQKLDLKQLDAATRKSIGDVADAVEDIRSWVNVAANRPGNWLIGVHS
jgi:hypothetical protein